MAASQVPIVQPKQIISTIVLSLIIPGAGQFILKRRWRGVIIFLTAGMLGFLVDWTLVNLKLAQVSIDPLVTSWLWLPFFLFWVWNVVDARQTAAKWKTNGWLAVFLAAIILYVIAWQVTGVKLDRLVTRFDDARKVMADLINPDFFSIGSQESPETCSWNCLYGYLKDRLEGRTPLVEPRISENVKDIFGKIAQKKAPAWETLLRLVPPGKDVNSFEAGKLIETIAIGIMATLFSTILAIPISFFAAHNIMSRLPGGPFIYYIARGILNIVRAVDTVVWGLLIVVWIGLGSFAGVIALTIHSVAALGKLFSEEIEHIDSGQVEALTATGANLFQVIRYGVMPQITPPFLAYSLLRWDINMRSATVIGFVGGGGIGFFVVETIRMGAFQQYAAALWAIAVVIILVDYISARWRGSILKDQPRELAGAAHPRLNFLKKAFYILIGAGLFIYCWNVTEIKLAELFSPAPTFLQLVSDFIHIDLRSDVLNKILTEMLVTIFQALLASTLGALVAFPFSFLAARNLTGRSKVFIWIYYGVRSLFNLMRSIEALLYVAIFVAWVGIGPFAGTLALAVTTFALIGKLFSEAIENIDPGPIEAVTATGANRLQVLNFAVLPQIIPPFVAYMIYQWDINIRMATIIGFAGGGGIGLTLSTYFGLLQYHRAGTVVVVIVIVVALMDFASAKLREKLI